MCKNIKTLEVAILPLTYRCNAKCAMCGIGDLKQWEELSLAEYKHIFSDKVWKDNIRSVNITGGEPFMRSDIYGFTELLLENTNKLEALIVNTNGIMTDKIVEYVKKIAMLCEERNIDFKIYISIDGIDETHDKIRKVNNCFQKVNQTLQKLKQLKENIDFGIVLNCTVTSYNYRNVYEVFNYADENSFEINYTYAMISSVYFQNENKLTNMENAENEYLKAFLKKLIREEEGARMSAYYRNLIYMLEGKERMVGCIFQDKGIFIHPSGEVFRCWVYDKSIGNVKKCSLSTIWNNQHEKCAVEEIKERCKSCFNNCYQEYQRLMAIERIFLGERR